MMLVFVQFITTRLALPLYLKYTDSSFTRLKMLKGFYKLFREVKKKKSQLWNCVLIISSVLNQEMDCSMHVSF